MGRIITTILESPAWGVGTGVAMAVATILLAVATFHLVQATRHLGRTADTQLAVLERRERRDLRFSFGTGMDGERLRYAGVDVANAGVPPATLMGARISLAIPAAATASEIHSALRWTDDSDFEPKQRLLQGDRVSIRFDLDTLAERLDPGQRYRYEVWDSLGSVYASPWMDHDSEAGTVTHYTTTGEGFREPARQVAQMWGRRTGG